MATILEFPQSDSSSRGSASHCGSATCEIIIFPGIRYERWEDHAPQPEEAAPRKKARAKKRDRMELPD